MGKLSNFRGKLVRGTIVLGDLLPEPIEIFLVEKLGDSLKLVGKGLNTGTVHEPILDISQLETIRILSGKCEYDGDAQKFKLGMEAMRLKLAYEYDPYFSLSIARIDPLPHQLEAVYHYFLKAPRIRFLLADDPGAGKTIMAGLLIKELKIRGLVERILIVAPANLTFQWQREMKDKFQESFKLIRGDILRADYGSNPWQENKQVVTSISWVSRIEDARESLLRSNWDLIVVDEAHKMSAYSNDKKTLAYRLGEELSERTDHYLLMTATPHKGDPENFTLFLRLLDKDVYGNVKSLETALEANDAPFYLRRTKEALVTFPDPETGKSQALFTKRKVTTTEFQITEKEFGLYDSLTQYVENQFFKASQEEGRQRMVVGFTMAMLQRRFASSIYALRRSLERMIDKRKLILEDPEEYRRKQILRKIPDDYDELDDWEQNKILDDLEGAVASYDRRDLKQDITELENLVQQAKILEKEEIESKLLKLRELFQNEGFFDDPKMKILIFTEHKDTLDFLVQKLEDWGLRVTQIHGGLKIGDRDIPGTRIYAEREFREEAQVMVATEAAGEGINLQFCWLMINYDIPWNPMRLEQRMGRIHRYGQEKDCLIFNFVSTNTREGRVMSRLFERIHAIEDDLDPERTGKIYNVLGDVFPANQLERMIREMYARNLTEDVITDRIVEQVDKENLDAITKSALEGLSKKELNLSSIIGKSAEAKERRLVPEVIQDFFLEASDVIGVKPKPVGKRKEVFNVGRLPRTLLPTGYKLEPKFGKLAKTYGKIVFDKEFLKKDPTLEWVTPGHILFEAVREDLQSRVKDDLQKGAVFFDINHQEPAKLDVFSVSIKNGRGNTLYQRLFVTESSLDGKILIKEPTIFLDITPASDVVRVPDAENLPSDQELEQELISSKLQSSLDEISDEIKNNVVRVIEHVEISLNELIHQQNLRMAGLQSKLQGGDASPLLKANIAKVEGRLDELNSRFETRMEKLKQEKFCTISDVHKVGSAWVLPHPERNSPQVAPMVRDEEIERIAVEIATQYEESQGWVVESVEAENRGFDLISRLPSPDDPEVSLDIRFIEVKGRAKVGLVALSPNEYKTAQRLKDDFWLYAVFNCGSDPQLNRIKDPSRLEWEPLVEVAHWQINSAKVKEANE